MKARMVAICLMVGLMAGMVAGGCSVVKERTSEAKSATKKATGPIAPPKRDVPGKRFTLPLGELYVAEFFNPNAAAKTDMVLFLHGAAWCAQQSFYDARKNAVLVSISVPNYGYGDVFRDPKKLAEVIETTTSTLAREHISAKPFGKLCLASFSGGYTGVREILKQKQHEGIISDVVLADSLYAPKVKGTTNQLEPEAMEPFLAYARRAAAGGSSLWFSHLFPPKKKYRDNTTTLAASYLIDRVGAERRGASRRNSRGAKLLYRADVGNFHVLGYAGMTTQDHFEHFYALSDLLRQTSLAEAERK